MKHLRRQLTSVLIFLLFYLFVAPAKVYAYLDPGSGSFVFQLLLGTLLGGLVAIKIYWKKVKNFFLNLFSKRKRGGTGSEQE